jgi:hypothetical protein
MEDHRPDQADERRPEDTAEEAAGAANSGGADQSPLGGDKRTEEQLDADNEVEKDALKSLDPDSPA